MSNLTHDEIQRLKIENAELRNRLGQPTPRELSITVSELREQLEQATTRAEAAEQEVRSLQDCINPTFCIELAELRAYRERTETALAELTGRCLEDEGFTDLSLADLRELGLRRLPDVDEQPSPAAPVEREGGE